MNYMDEYEKRHRVLTINDYGAEVTVRVSDGVTWHGLVEMAVNAIRGLGYSDVPAGDAAVEALETVMDPEAAMGGDIADLDPEVDSAAR